VIYPNVDLNKWIEKYDLGIETFSCPKCKKVFETIIPIMTIDSVGLQSQSHKCGPEYILVILTPRTDDALKFWNMIV